MSELKRIQDSKQADTLHKLRDMELRARELGIDISGLLIPDSTSSNVSSNKSKLITSVTGSLSSRDKLLRDKRIQEQNLVSTKKKLTLEL